MIMPDAAGVAGNLRLLCRNFTLFTSPIYICSCMKVHTAHELQPISRDFSHELQPMSRDLTQEGAPHMHWRRTPLPA